MVYTTNIKPETVLHNKSSMQPGSGDLIAAVEVAAAEHCCDDRHRYDVGCRQRRRCASHPLPAFGSRLPSRGVSKGREDMATSLMASTGAGAMVCRISGTPGKRRGGRQKQFPVRGPSDRTAAI